MSDLRDIVQHKYEESVETEANEMVEVIVEERRRFSLFNYYNSRTTHYVSS